jgi:hypothetical protein
VEFVELSLSDWWVVGWVLQESVKVCCLSRGVVWKRLCFEHFGMDLEHLQPLVVIDERNFHAWKPS